MKVFLTGLALAIAATGLYSQAKQADMPAATKIQKSKVEQDRECIKNLCGLYSVSFNFAETFSPDTAYKFHKRYTEHGIEYVFAAEETPGKIVLQHLLIVNDSIIIKHWRQDWVYENKAIYTYVKDNEWKQSALTAEQAKGTWTQKVYQVDDSPRYESYGSWVHVDGKHYWEGVNDAPLPRREYTQRDDYNVLRRHSRMEMTGDGWMLNQDNEKIVRGNGPDKLLCWEKGIERFTKSNSNAAPALKWWEKQKQYWSDVRKTWEEIYSKTPDLKLEARVNDKRLYETLFDLGDKLTAKSYNSAAANEEIKKAIAPYIKRV